MQPGDFLVEVLRQRVNADRIFVRFRPKRNLGDHLVGERIGHDERRMARCAAEIHQPTFGQQDDRPAAGHCVAIDQRLDVHVFYVGDGLQPGHVDLVIEVTDVADDRVLTHLLHVLGGDHVAAAGGSDEDVSARGGVFHRRHFKPLHRGLQRADRVDLGNQHSGAV